MYGNVMEWTESTALSLSPDNELVPDPYERFMTGGAWDALARGEGMKNPAVWGTGPNYTIPDLGFRCAKSAAP